MSCGPAALVVDENAHEERRRRPHPRQVLVASSNHQVATRRACGNAARDTLMASVVRRRRVARSMLGQCVRHVTQAVCRAPRDVATPQQRSLARRVSRRSASAAALCVVSEYLLYICDSRVTVTNRFDTILTFMNFPRPQLCIPDASLLLQLKGLTARLRRDPRALDGVFKLQRGFMNTSIQEDRATAAAGAGERPECGVRPAPGQASQG